MSQIKAIKIIKEIPLLGEEDSLESRLRKVTLRGFPEIKIYENAVLELEKLSESDVQEKIHTSQKRIYQTELDKVKILGELFSAEGIDICNLDAAYDYIAIDEEGNETEWTLLPPIVERIIIPKSQENTLDYSRIIDPKLKEFISLKGLSLNPEALKQIHSSETETFDLINDGSHRIHYGIQKGGIKVMRIKNATKGFPYYATPQKYNVSIFATREEALSLPETKVHIVTDPGHKALYRLFPSGGIKSGDIRPEKKLT